MKRGFAWAALGLAGAACASSEADPESPEQEPGATNGEPRAAEPRRLPIPEIDRDRCDPEGKEEVTYDLNRDGEPNLWELYATIEEDGAPVEVLTCKQADFDGDGSADYVAIYGEGGEMIAEEFDLSFDGEFDVRTHYDESSGRVALAERKTDFGAEADVWERYDGDGNLELVERDRRGDGDPDMWEQYEEGRLVAILYDDTADGRVDRREEAPRDAGEEATDEPDPAEEEILEDEADAAEDMLEGDLEDADPMPEAE